MQFESKRKRTLWTAAALGTIPDIAISLAVTYIFNGGFIGFIAAFLGLQVLYLAIWAKNSIWTWITFSYLGERKKLAAWFFDYFRENGYPEPGSYEKSIDGYLISVIDNENLPVLLRLKAAHELGALRYLESAAQVQQSLRLSIAFEDGLEQFKRTFPAAPVNSTSQPTPAGGRG